MTFERISPTTSTTGTHNIDHILSQHSQSLLLPDGRFDFLHSLEEEDCVESLGEEYSDWGNESGHTKEWYYLAPSGSVVGVAFRYGCARVRGHSTTTTQDVVGFIDFLRQTVKN